MLLRILFNIAMNFFLQILTSEWMCLCIELEIWQDRRYTSNKWKISKEMIENWDKNIENAIKSDFY